MKNITKPYSVHPYAEMVAQKCPWIADVRSRIEARIAEFEKFIVDQSYKDGQPEMADEQHLYKCFKYNEEHNQYYGNLTVLKYFAWNFKVKILREVIGDWCFTEHDVEMYNYFRNADFSKVSVGKFFYKWDKEEKSPSMFVHDRNCKWMMKLDGELEFYFNLFYKEIILLNDMIRNIRGSNLLFPEDQFFDGAILHGGLNVSKQIDYGDFETRVFSKG